MASGGRPFEETRSHQAGVSPSEELEDVAGHQRRSEALKRGRTRSSRPESSSSSSSRLTSTLKREDAFISPVSPGMSATFPACSSAEPSLRCPPRLPGSAAPLPRSRSASRSRRLLPHPSSLDVVRETREELDIVTVRRADVPRILIRRSTYSPAHEETLAPRPLVEGLLGVSSPVRAVSPFVAPLSTPELVLSSVADHGAEEKSCEDQDPRYLRAGWWRGDE